MDLPTHERLWRGARRRLQQAFDLRLVRWYRLGAHQQAWYLRRLFKLLDTDLVLDVGGNEGQFADFLRRQVGYRGPLITFEPIPELAQRLSERARRDGAWTVVQAALGEEQRSDVFNVMKSSPLSSLLPPSHEETGRLEQHNEVARRIPIEVRTLDSFMAGHPEAASARSVYLKLDVQGYERHVLQGALQTLPRIAALQAELSVIPIYRDVPDYKALMGFVEELGYVLSFIPAHNYEQFPDMIDFDCHFVKRERLQALGLLKRGIAGGHA